MIKISQFTSWNHHRSGWNFCIDQIKYLHSDCGVLFIDYLEKFIKEKKSIQVPWIGIVHNPVRMPQIVSSLYGKKNNLDLISLLKSDTWQISKKKCKGLFCFSSDSLNFLKINADVKVEMLLHTTAHSDMIFNFESFLNNREKKIIHIGHWLRNFQSIFELKTTYSKFILKVPSFTFNYEKIKKHFSVNDSVKYIDYVDSKSYDSYLSQNLVFLDLFSASANNVVLECLSRGTPILLNRLQSFKDYLGDDYPFFYDDLDHASLLIHNQDLIYKTSLYLKNRWSNFPNFSQSFQNSNIFKSISCIKFL